MKNPSPYPFFVPYLARLLMFFCQDEKWIYFWVQSFFIAINVIAVFIICNKIKMSPACSFWAASALLWLPVSVMACRTFNLDYPLAAVLSLWLLSYLYTKKFARPKAVIVFAILYFLMFLTKYSFILYAMPFAIMMIYDLRGHKQRLIYFIALLSALSLLCLLYINSYVGWGILSYAKHNITAQTSFHLNLLNGAKFCSLWLCGYLVELKAIVLTPCVFWLSAIGLIAIAVHKKLRKKYSFIIFACAYPVFFAIFTTGDIRYYFPFLSMYCISAAFALKNSPKLRSIALIIIAIQGISMSSGWMLSYPIPRCPAKFLYSDMLLSQLTRGLPYNYSVEPSCSNNQCRIFFDKGGNLENLFNYKCGWSDSLIWTVMPCETDWAEKFSFLLNLPPRSKIKIITADPYFDQTFLPVLPEQLASFLQYLSVLEKKELIIDNRLADSDYDYVMQYEDANDLPKNNQRRNYDIELSNIILKQCKLIRVEQIDSFSIRLYERDKQLQHLR